MIKLVRNYFFCLLMVLTTGSFCSGQSAMIDSLKSRLPYTNGEERIRTLILLSYHHLRISVEESFEYSELALDYSIETHNERGVARAYLMIGSAYNEKGAYSRAIRNQQEALKIFEKLQDTSAIGITFNNLGLNYHNLGKYDEAIKQYQNSYSIAKNSENDPDLFLSLINLGIVYDEWGKYDLALEHYRNAFAIANEINDDAYKGISLQNIGYVHFETQQYDSALFYFEQSLNISKDIGDKTGIFNTLVNTGEVFVELLNYNRAIENFSLALLNATESGNSNNIILASLKLGDAYRLNTQYAESLPLLQEALSQAQNNEDPKLIKDALMALSDFYFSTADYMHAYQRFKEYTTIKDTLFNRDSRHEISEMQTLYELDKKEAEIEIQHLRIEKQRNRIYFILLAIIVLVVIAYLVFNRYKLKQKHYRIELEKKNIDIEQRLLRTQMNPHFIFNSLNSINSFITDNNSDSAQSFLSKFASLMRYILDNSRKTMVPLEDEINTLQLNMELEQLRFDNKFDFKIQVDESFDPEFTFIPPMLIQPFIENAIIHGLAPKESDGLLRVELNRNGELMHCKIEDNGVGRKKAMEIKARSGKAKHKSLGMQVTRERLEILNEKTQEEVSFQIIDLQDESGNSIGTRVDLRIPYEEE